VHDRERASVLMLMPAAVLVFVVLGALCVDFGGVWAAHRRLDAAAEAAANDVATQALDLDALYAGGEVRLVPGLASEIAMRSVAAAGLERFEVVVESVTVDGGVVVVTLTGTAHHLFARAVPGGLSSTPLRSSAEASAEVS
jgi:hypothetical protein